MRSSDRGYVTAEAAVVLPAMALFTVALIWGLMAAAAQIQCVDAARAGARAAARAEPEEATLAAARTTAPEGAEISVKREDGLVRVRVEAPAGPGALPVRLGAEAVALDESMASPPGAGQGAAGSEAGDEEGDGVTSEGSVTSEGKGAAGGSR
ncbi:TadE family type IV pilus minor pilin [Streptomyces sp. TP-A0874]|uniref:TadE family type IV pilus minor pilin n=1 Tax=Streptomyces sp. TP-A0874 TaxID=549819 RepID=UPI000852E62C|nr:TadE family type IV pilus minor pilin [Streptomyces sp. TP-A0874]